ncbi:MAG: hypothetical protein M3Y87_33980 [Myxococcota bacterium]|nr:hypothetical protein [Myxococcota bacterium]
MDDHPTEALIWMTALAAAIDRAQGATSQLERLAALEALDEARQRLDEVLAQVREELTHGFAPRALVS